MISRQQIIRGQQCGPAVSQQVVGSGASSCASGSSGNSSSTSANGKSLRTSASQHPSGKSSTPARQNYARAASSGKLIMSALHRQSAGTMLPDELLVRDDQDSADEIELDVQQDSSDGYVANQYDDYMQHQSGATTATTNSSSAAAGYWKANHVKATAAAANHQVAGNQRQFDPYSIYSDDDEVWYSEERLFEDHLDEIYNKWRLLDDDIWCKLIMMERNRRIGKAYARVPMVTIDGSHELSYDGQKLALNGFDNPDRDAKTEECRKRIGKGIRIKMDDYGNILIRRLSKAGVFIKEWLVVESVGSDGIGSGDSPPRSRLMPSRQQLIENTLQKSPATGASMTPTSSSTSGGSSMEPSNDSAVCDEILSVGGRLEPDKIYIMFDMEKFKANITQELCRQYPDRRKLEQQCFSIVGLVRDTDDVLNLPCWVMVINIVAIQMLNERFKSVPAIEPRGQLQAPSFVSIFDQHPGRRAAANKEEDPYSLPANASSSDVKSSINDYGTTSAIVHSQAGGRNPSARYYDNESAANHLPASRRAEMYANKSSPSTRANGDPTTGAGLRHRSKSNNNIYGRTNGHHQPHPRNLVYHNGRDHRAASSRADRYNNSSSIYSPGHMLVPPPAGDPNVPPKLPPRDFVSRLKSRSSSNVHAPDQQQVVGLSPSGKIDDASEQIYSTGMLEASKSRKVKKNRFLESLKAPTATGARSASVIGSPISDQAAPATVAAAAAAAPPSAKSVKSPGKSLKSLLGVKSSKSNAAKQVAAPKPNRVAEDSSGYVHLDNDPSSDKTANYNDLDIPTPDYETDYVPDENHYATGLTGSKSIHHDKQALAKARTAHGGERGTRENSRFSARHNGETDNNGAKSTHRDAAMIYGSSAGLAGANPRPMGGSRYRSSSMQRHFPNSTTLRSQYQVGGGRGNISSRAAYDDRENPYAMGGHAIGMHYSSAGAHHLIDSQGHYGIIGGGGPRRRPSSRVGSVAHLGQHPASQHLLHPSYSPPSGSHNTLGSALSRSSQYDIGRSSSGIYGNNSSSSSSDYADWQPQMRKVNSGGYLNSIFKSHLVSGSPLGVDGSDLYGTGDLVAAGNQRGGSNYATSRALKSTANGVASHRAPPVKRQDQLAAKQQQVVGSGVNGPAYRSYDSSNDSEPSYTNSSDGLDIYDHIGQQQQQIPNGRVSRRHQFLNMQPNANQHNRTLAPEVHVGEWENMYDR